MTNRVFATLPKAPANAESFHIAALIVAGRRNVGDEMTALIDGLAFEIVALTAASARRVADAYAHWGKGAHQAALNFGDCFAYEVARGQACALLFVGEEFARTDVAKAPP